MDFKTFAKAVNDRFNHLSTNYTLFRVEADNDEIKEVYLSSFPEGTNLTYLTNTEHDCSCCKAFIRNVGKLVAIDNGAILTVWDVEATGHYKVVADAMANYVRSKPVESVFFASERKYGAFNTEQRLADGRIINWNHFHAGMPASLFKGNDVASEAGRFNTSAQMLTTSLTVFNLPAIDTVIDLITSSSLYRGEEHLPSIKKFRELWVKSVDYPGSPTLFGFEHCNDPISRFKNSVIGTLVEDISKGVDLEEAVKSFEVKVAPANYKRSKSLITQGMVDQAMETITELGLEPALERRHATIHDMNINDVLWSDVSVQPAMKGSVASILQQAVKITKPNTDKSIEISIADFMERVLPTATSIEALVESRHQSNFMSVIAPVNASANLLKWNNNFTWSYNGNVTDSMKDVVKSFGGKVKAQLRCSIMWNEDNDNPDDLDLHCVSPYGHIYFVDKGTKTFNLDIDITQPGSKVAVENITHDFSKMRPGSYNFYVKNYIARGASSGFKAEIEFNGEVYEYTYLAPLREGQNVEIATVKVDNNGIISIEHKLPHGSTSKEVYNIKTNDFVKVTNVMLSPNHWNEQAIGNKHYMFILNNCGTAEPVRGFYNEFLSEALTPHRKVFEVLSSRMRVQPATEQLAGVGFSSTVRNDLVVRVSTTSSMKLYKINF